MKTKERLETAKTINILAKTLDVLASKVEAKKECVKLCAIKAFEAKLSQIVYSTKYISMNIRFGVKSLILGLLKPLQVLLLESSLGVKPLVQRAIPQTNITKANFLKAVVVCWPFVLYLCFGYAVTEAVTPRKKDCYSVNLMVVPHTYISNSNISNSKFFTNNLKYFPKKESLFQRSPI